MLHARSAGLLKARVVCELLGFWLLGTLFGVGTRALSGGVVARNEVCVCELGRACSIL